MVAEPNCLSRDIAAQRSSTIDTFLRESMQLADAPVVRHVILRRNPDVGYGLALVSHELQTNPPSYAHVVRVVKANSPAGWDGLVRMGDRMVSIDARPTVYMCGKELRMLLALSDEVSLELQTPPTLFCKAAMQPHATVSTGLQLGRSAGHPDIRRVTLTNTGHGFGLAVVPCANGLGARVAVVLKGGLAEQSVLVQEGDRIIGIGDSDVDEFAHADTIALLSTHKTVVLTLVKDESPMRYAGIVQSPTSRITTGARNAAGSLTGFIVSTRQVLLRTVPGRSLGLVATSNPSGLGACVSRIHVGSPAWETGLINVHDRIMEINGKAVHHRPVGDVLRELDLALKGSSLLLTLQPFDTHDKENTHTSLKIEPAN